MKRLYANILWTTLLVLVAEACLIGVYFRYFRGSPNERPFEFLLIAILIAVNLPILKLLPRWFVIFKGDVCFTADINTDIPIELSFPIDLTDIRSGLLVIFFTNSSPECVGRKIKFQPENEGAGEIIDDCGEPKPLGFGDTKRTAANWSKGTGDVKKPLIYNWPNGHAAHSKGTLEMAFDWNFVGTYLERKLPRNRTLEGQVILFRK